MPARIAKPERNAVRASYVIALLVVMALIGWYAVTAIGHDAQHNIPQSVPSVQVHKLTFGAGALTVAQGHSTYYKMDVPADAMNVRCFSLLSPKAVQQNIALTYSSRYNRSADMHSGAAASLGTDFATCTKISQNAAIL